MAVFRCAISKSSCVLLHVNLYICASMWLRCTYQSCHARSTQQSCYYVVGEVSFCHRKMLGSDLVHAQTLFVVHLVTLVQRQQTYEASPPLLYAIFDLGEWY